jgi:hypothetical protein
LNGPDEIVLELDTLTKRSFISIPVVRLSEESMGLSVGRKRPTEIPEKLIFLGFRVKIGESIRRKTFDYLN